MSKNRNTMIISYKEKDHTAYMNLFRLLYKLGVIDSYSGSAHLTPDMDFVYTAFVCAERKTANLQVYRVR